MFKFRGLTQRAQRVLSILAPEEAKKLNSDKIQPEHIVLALLKDGTGVAVKALQKIRINIADMIQVMEHRIPKNVVKESVQAES